ncbi:MAG: hypothetical protein WBG92_13585 [Thiohalocapsa sp.]
MAAVGLFLLMYQWGNQYKQPDQRTPALTGVLIRPPQTLPEFALSDANGDPFGRADLIDRWSLMAIAPIGDARGHLGIARLVEIFNRLADRPKLQHRMRLLLISADVAPRLARDFERLSPSITVLSGERTEFETLSAAALGADLHAAADSLPALFLIDDSARLTALFPASQFAAAVGADVAALANWDHSRIAISDE